MVKVKALPSILDIYSTAHPLGFMLWLHRHLPGWLDVDKFAEAMKSNVFVGKDFGSVLPEGTALSFATLRTLKNDCWGVFESLGWFTRLQDQNPRSVGLLYGLSKVFDKGNEFVVMRPGREALVSMAGTLSDFSLRDYSQPFPVMTVDVSEFNRPVSAMGLNYVTIISSPDLPYISVIGWGRDNISNTISLLAEGPLSYVWSGFDHEIPKGREIARYIKIAMNYLFISKLAGVERQRAKPPTQTRFFQSWLKKKQNSKSIIKSADAKAALAAPSVLYKIKHEDSIQWFRKRRTESRRDARNGVFSKSCYGKNRDKYRYMFRGPECDPQVVYRHFND